jgi:tetratricopeptide (TPR) repeat protein
MLNKSSIFHFLLLIPLLASGCAHKKAYKRALAFAEEGQFVEAAEQDLRALDKKPEYDDAKDHLKIVAPRAYQELLDRSQHLQSLSRWIEAIESYQYMESLVSRFNDHNIVLQTIDIPNRIAWARQEGRDYHYETADRFFQSGEYSQAIEEYNKVSAIAGYYLDTREKLWQSHIELGNQLFSARQYESAINRYFRPALEFEINTGETEMLIAESYYQWADQLASDGDHRRAYETFGRSLEVIPDYRDAVQRQEEAFEEALQRVAVLPFRNSTPFGGQYSNLLTDQVINRCINANLQYVVFATRSHLDRIVQEYELTVAGAVDPSTAMEIGKLEGIHFFITGNLTQISEQTTSPSSVERTLNKVITVRDSTGKEVKRTEKRYYREYTSRRTIQLGASYQIVDAETGRYIRGEDFSERIVDEARWIRYQGSINDLPENKRHLLDASTEPKSADMLINDGVRIIAEKMSQKIIRYYR